MLFNLGLLVVFLGEIVWINSLDDNFFWFFFNNVVYNVCVYKFKWFKFCGKYK